MRRDDVERIASKVASLLRRGPRARKPRKPPRRRPRPVIASGRGADAFASDITVLLNAPRSPRRACLQSQIAAIASELVARLAPPERQQDLPMELIEI